MSKTAYLSPQSSGTSCKTAVLSSSFYGTARLAPSPVIMQAFNRLLRIAIGVVNSIYIFSCAQVFDITLFQHLFRSAYYYRNTLINPTGVIVTSSNSNS